MRLSELRADFATSLVDEAKIYRRVLTSDGQGGQLDSGTPELVGTYSARISPLGPGLSGFQAERKVADRLMGQTGWYLELPYGASVELTDYAEVMVLENLNTKTLEVIGAMDPRTFQIGTRLYTVEVI